MAVVSKNVVLDGVELTRFNSDKNTKIKCTDDGNIYPIAYVTRDATVAFEDTDIPLNEITAGAIVSADNVRGLDEYVRNEVDFLSDGKVDNEVLVDMGGASD